MIMTWKDEAGREVYRHPSTHLMAQAVKALYPQAKLTVGPPLEDKFYYDIAMPPDATLGEDDFAAIEAKMREFVAGRFAHRARGSFTRRGARTVPKHR